MRRPATATQSLIIVAMQCRSPGVQPYWRLTRAVAGRFGPKGGGGQHVARVDRALLESEGTVKCCMSGGDKYGTMGGKWRKYARAGKCVFTGRFSGYPGVNPGSAAKAMAEHTFRRKMDRNPDFPEKPK